MSTYFKMWNATTTADEPSAYIPDPPRSVGLQCSGKSITQGLEKGTIVWDAMTLAAWIDIRDKYNTNKDSSGTFVIPAYTSGGSWTSWRSVTAYALEQPDCEYRDRNVYRVTMRIVITA